MEPVYDGKTAVYCDLQEDGSFLLEHGKGCSIQCASGYAPDNRQYVCDRGVFGVKPRCLKQSCAVPPPVNLSGGWFFPTTREVGATTNPACTPGFEPFGEMLCVAPPGNCNECEPVFEGNAHCERMMCENRTRIPSAARRSRAGVNTVTFC